MAGLGQVPDLVWFSHKPREVGVTLSSGEMWKPRLREARAHSEEVVWPDFTRSCGDAV